MILTLLRLALATGVLLVPGALWARALGLPGVAPAVSFSLGAAFLALGVVFAAGTALWVALVVLALVALAALPLALRRRRAAGVPGRWWILATGAAFGLALWPVAGEIGGDGLFHLARARKLLELDSLSLEAVGEFADGGLHPGYAFPLWQGLLALVAQVSFLDPSQVVLHGPTVLAPFAFLAVYEAGFAVFRSAGAAVAVLAAQVAMTALAPRYGGAYTALALPATATRQILVPAALALVFAAVAAPSRGAFGAIACAGIAVAVVHPTYALFLWIPLGGFLLARLLVERREGALVAAGLTAFALPAVTYLGWLLPVVRETVSHSPGPQEVQRALRHYAGQLDVYSDGSYRLAPEVFGRGGAVAVAALLVVPLAAFAARRRWASLVLGGSLAVFVLMLLPALFTPFADLVSLSQARRAAGFWPLAFAFAGGWAVLAGRLRWAAVPLALAAGVVLQRLEPGDFAYRLKDGGPAWAVWWAVGGGAAALALGVLVRRNLWREARGVVVAVCALAFVAPIGVHAIPSWKPSPGRPPPRVTDGLVEAVRERVPNGAVVFSDVETSYELAAFAPVYVAAAPPGHVADTEANRPYERRDAARRFFATGDLAIVRRFGARWLVVDRARFDVRPSLRPVYRDRRFTLYRL